MINIVMVEDDSELSALLVEFLKRFSMEVTPFSSPEMFLTAIADKLYDLAIIDLTLPHSDGLELCLPLKNRGIPFIISSARTDLSDKLIGIERGADDYLPKPYDPRELVARIQMVLRRVQSPKVIVTKELFRVEEEKMVIFFDDKQLDLTLAEYEILALMIKRKGCVLSRDMIADNVSSMKWESSERSIDVVISRIRKKLGDNSKSPLFIKAIKGAGYKFIG